MMWCKYTCKNTPRWLHISPYNISAVNIFQYSLKHLIYVIALRKHTDLRCKNKYRSKNFLAITDAFSMYNNAFKSMVSSSLAICSRTCTCTVYTEPYECFKTTSSGSSERLVVWRGNKIWRCFWPTNLAASAFDKTRFNFKLKRQQCWIYTV